MKVILLLLVILAISDAQFGGGYYGRPYYRPVRPGRWYRPGWGMGGWRRPGWGMGYHRPGFGFGFNIGKRNAVAEPESEPEAALPPFQFQTYPVSNYWGFYPNPMPIPMPAQMPVPMPAPMPTPMLAQAQPEKPNKVEEELEIAKETEATHMEKREAEALLPFQITKTTPWKSFSLGFGGLGGFGGYRHYGGYQPYGGYGGYRQYGYPYGYGF